MCLIACMLLAMECLLAPLLMSSHFTLLSQESWPELILTPVPWNDPGPVDSSLATLQLERGLKTLLSRKPNWSGPTRMVLASCQDGLLPPPFLELLQRGCIWPGTTLLHPGGQPGLMATERMEETEEVSGWVLGPHVRHWIHSCSKLVLPRSVKFSPFPYGIRTSLLSVDTCLHA